MGRQGASLVALIIIFCVLGSAFTFNIPVIASDAPLGQPMTVITTTAQVPENVSQCVIRWGVQEANGTVIWMRGYAYPYPPPSPCKNMTEYATDALGRTIVIHQFLQTFTFLTPAVVTVTVTYSSGTGHD